MSQSASGPVGRPVPRVDGVAKVTGAAQYLDDLPLAGARHGVTVRSTCPHGILEGIDRDPAFDWSDVTVVTAADIAWGAPTKHGFAENVVVMIEHDQPALVPIGGRIKHWDEADLRGPTFRKGPTAAQPAPAAP